MGRTLARATILVVAIFLMLYSITVAAISFSKLNITAFHLSQPLLIGYGVFWLIVAPSGLWGIFGSTQNNTDLCNRYLRDHWFSSALISIIDVIKIVFSFTMKDNAIQKCMIEIQTTEDCRKKIDLFQKAGLIAFGVQGFLMVGLGILVWFCCKQLMKKNDVKAKVEVEHDLETQNTRQLNEDDIINLRNTPLDRVETNPPLFRDRRPSLHSNKGQKEQQKIKKDDENVVRSREVPGGIMNVNNVDVKNIDNINNTKNVNNVDNIKNVNNNNNIRNANNDVNNVKNVQRSDQQQYTTPLRSRKSYDRQMTPSDELQGYPPQGMNRTVPMSRSKSMAPPVRSNSSRFPPPQPEYRFIPSIQYPQGVQKGRVPIPPPYYYNRPRFQQMPNVPPLYPWQQQWTGYNNGQIPPQGDFRGHRRSKSQPELRPLSFHPSFMGYQIPSNPPQIPKQQAIPQQKIERQQKIPVDSKDKRNNENNNNSQNTSAANSRRSSTSSRYKPPILPKNEKRPYSQMHRANSLPNLSSHEDLMRNEMLFAPPVPLIPSSLQSNTKNNKDNKSDNTKNKKNNNKDDKFNNKNTQESQPPIINNADKFERFIKMYGDKEYNMTSENSQYNKQYNNVNNNGWNTDDGNYVPPKKQRPKSAQAVRGEASPKPSIYAEDVDNRYYNDYHYHQPPSGYNNYVYPQYVRPMGYNNGGYNNNGENIVRNNPMGYNGGWVNYGQQRPQRMNYYY
ncbi:hypothetical protein RclHR1_00760022 [Rhizophagus clarus]|uniref:Uncharacterized protein n=1 Tax=Rhizophagus clarus TaxID=94130 RepID=A0A2Z6SDG1_9GLOM|nr:hypothetical protein RclHR1_00760022 [Rhizophagus clarus]